MMRTESMELAGAILGGFGRHVSWDSDPPLSPKRRKIHVPEASSVLIIWTEEHSKLQGVYVQRRPTWRAQASWDSRFLSALLPTHTMVDRSPDLAPSSGPKLIFDAHAQARAPSARRAYS